MSLAALSAAGAFVDPAPIETTVDWKGETYKVWVVRQSAYEMQRALRAMRDNGQLSADDPDLVRYVLVHLNFRFGDEREQMPLEDALRLTPEFVDALEKSFAQIQEVPKVSRPKKKAGAN